MCVIDAFTIAGYSVLFSRKENQTFRYRSNRSKRNQKVLICFP